MSENRTIKFSHLDDVLIDVPVELGNIQFGNEFIVEMPELNQKFGGRLTPVGGKFISLNAKDETIGELSLTVESGKRINFQYRFKARFDKSVYNKQMNLSFKINGTKTIIGLMPYFNELKFNQKINNDEIFIHVDEKIVGKPKIDGLDNVEIHAYNRPNNSFVRITRDMRLNGLELILDTLNGKKIAVINIPETEKQPDLIPTLVKGSYKWKNETIATLQRNVAYNIRFDIDNVKVFEVNEPIKSIDRLKKAKWELNKMDDRTFIIRPNRKISLYCATVTIDKKRYFKNFKIITK